MAPTQCLLLGIVASIPLALAGNIVSRQAPGDDWPIKTAYVHFGDSYGAGMGTGVTSPDQCRVGSNNFGRLLNEYTDNEDVQYQELVCSGDTTFGLNKKIDAWLNPEFADVATLSMGGNDLGFSDIVDSCVINVLNSASAAEKCDEAKQNANNLLDDFETGLANKLETAYLRIMEKSANENFHLYVTLYPRFFNEFDPDCDKTIFNFWNPSYDPPASDTNIYLETWLRRELNGLVTKFNSIIQIAVDNAQIWGDQKYQSRIHSVDPNPKFDLEPGHRWCEDGDFHEPDEDRMDTWFFLSGWKDTPISDDAAEAAISIAIAAQEGDQKNAYITEGRISMPDPEDCEAQLDDAESEGMDPWERTLCVRAIDIRDHPEGKWASTLAAANEQIAAGDVEGQDVDWFLPTRWVKTFHPRSRGMEAYRDAIIEAIQENQVNPTESAKRRRSVAYVA